MLQNSTYEIEESFFNEISEKMQMIRKTTIVIVQTMMKIRENCAYNILGGKYDLTRLSKRYHFDKNYLIKMKDQLDFLKQSNLKHYYNFIEGDPFLLQLSESRTQTDRIVTLTEEMNEEINRCKYYILIDMIYFQFGNVRGKIFKEMSPNTIKMIRQSNVSTNSFSKQRDSSLKKQKRKLPQITIIQKGMPTSPMNTNSLDYSIQSKTDIAKLGSDQPQKNTSYRSQLMNSIDVNNKSIDNNQPQILNKDSQGSYSTTNIAYEKRHYNLKPVAIRKEMPKINSKPSPDNNELQKGVKVGNNTSIEKKSGIILNQVLNQQNNEKRRKSDMKTNKDLKLFIKEKKDKNGKEEGLLSPINNGHSNSSNINKLAHKPMSLTIETNKPTKLDDQQLNIKNHSDPKNLNKQKERESDLNKKNESMKKSNLSETNSNKEKEYKDANVNNANENANAFDNTCNNNNNVINQNDKKEITVKEDNFNNNSEDKSIKEKENNQTMTKDKTKVSNEETVKQHNEDLTTKLDKKQNTKESKLQNGVVQTESSHEGSKVQNDVLSQEGNKSIVNCEHKKELMQNKAEEQKNKSKTNLMINQPEALKPKENIEKQSVKSDEKEQSVITNEIIDNTKFEYNQVQRTHDFKLDNNSIKEEFDRENQIIKTTQLDLMAKEQQGKLEEDQMQNNQQQNQNNEDEVELNKDKALTEEQKQNNNSKDILKENKEQLKPIDLLLKEEPKVINQSNESDKLKNPSVINNNSL